MGINMHIKDTWEVTMEELMSMLPNSKATKQVNKLIAEVESLRSQVATLTEESDRAIQLHMRSYNEACDDLHAAFALERLKIISTTARDCKEIALNARHPANLGLDISYVITTKYGV